MSAFLEYLEYLWNQLSNINVIDVIDIIIVAFLFYWVFTFVRDRRAGKLLVGIVFLVVLLFISNLLDMHALNFILTNMFSVGIVAIVIVFQPELRSALEKVGGESLKNFKGRMDSEETAIIRSAVSEVSKAAENLSHTRTGALVVFERTTRLGDYIRTGTIVDAVPSAFLLENIFFNKAPLHDGAVIIREGRVHSAGCFLPLSNSDDIIKDLGTRHRAAIGMSENSDAIVLVVSEENGIISVAADGELKRNFNRQTLEEYLTATLVPDEKNIGERMKGKFFKRSVKTKDDVEEQK
ncbi:MAG: diadenylate cyclase CdaA [Clostridia bacterium]|nr:diadenylate cyclase CdaA [Clostridia bacterium]